MNHVEAFALFDRIGIPASAGANGNDFVKKAAEHIRDLEALAELRFKTIPKPDKNTMLVVSSDDLEERLIDTLRKKLGGRGGVILGTDSDSDIYTVAKPRAGDVLVFRGGGAEHLSEEERATIRKAFPEVKVIFCDIDTDVQSVPEIKQLGMALNTAHSRLISMLEALEYGGHSLDDAQQSINEVFAAIKIYNQL
jgi:hypothetical protein